MQWQSVFATVTHGFEVSKPFLAALVLISAFVLIGDQGSKLSLRRNSPCLAAFCVFAFALGTGLVAWYLVLIPLIAVYNLAITLNYPLMTMYWAFWLLAGVLISARKLMYDAGNIRVDRNRNLHL